MSEIPVDPGDAARLNRLLGLLQKILWEQGADGTLRPAGPADALNDLGLYMLGHEIDMAVERLQAFAAPVAPAWQPITEEAVKGKSYLLLRPIADLKAQAPVVAKFGYSAIEGDPEWQQDGGISYAFHCFDGFMPLPAAPEAQGGADHD